MANTRNRDKPRKTSRARPELGVVRVQCNPAPDAEDRLRRLFTLLVKHAAGNGITPPEQKSPLEEGGAGGK